MVSTTISLDNKTPSTSDPKAIAVPLATTSVQKLDLSSSLNEKISILFPKCRPKSDINLNPMNNNSMTTPPSSSLSSESSAATKSPNINTNPFLMSRPVEKNTTSYYYKTKEDYDFQPNSAVSNYTQKLLAQKPTYYQSSQNPFIKDNSHWETRKRTPNTTPASTVLNSPDLTEIETRVTYPKTGHHIRVGRSPVNHTDGSNSVEVVSPTKMAVEDGEVVVFDDIGENWQSTYKYISNAFIELPESD